MRKITLILMAIAASAMLPATADEKLESIRALVDELFPGIEGELVVYAPIEGWVTIQKGAVVAYMSEDGQYLMQGDLLDLKNNVNVSELSRNMARRALIESVGDDDVIAFTPDQVRHSVTVFTDIDCAYCRRLHAQIDDYMANGIEVRYMLYPRSGPASASWSTAEDVWCASDRNSALTAAKLDRGFETKQCDATEISRHFSIGQDVGLRGTPAIVFANGTLVSGWLPPDEMSAQLEQMFPSD